MGDVVEASGKLTEGGIVMILLFLILSLGGGVTTLVVSVHRQFFGSKVKEGFVPRLVVKHEAFLDRMASAIEQVADSTEKNTAISQGIDESVAKLLRFMEASHVDLKAFGSIWEFNIKILRVVATKDGIIDDIQPLLVEMERILQRRNSSKEC